MKKKIILICGAVAAMTVIAFGSYAEFFSKWYADAKPSITVYANTDMRRDCGQVSFGEEVNVLEETEIFKRDYVNHENHLYTVCRIKTDTNEGWVYKNLLSHFKKQKP